MASDAEVEAGAQAMWSYCTSSNHENDGAYEGPSCPVCIEAATAVLEAAEATRPEPIGYAVVDKEGRRYRIDIDHTPGAAERWDRTRPRLAPHRVCALVPLDSQENPR